MSTLGEAFGHAWDDLTQLWEGRHDRAGLAVLGELLADAGGYTGGRAVQRALADAAGVSLRTAERWLTNAGQQRNVSKQSEARIREAAQAQAVPALLKRIEAGEYDLAVEFEDTEVEVES